MKSRLKFILACILSEVVAISYPKKTVIHSTSKRGFLHLRGGSSCVSSDHDTITDHSTEESTSQRAPGSNNVEDAEASRSEAQSKRVPRHQLTPLDTLNLLVSESNNLFFSEHGRCGAASRKSQRCTEGYQVAAATNAFAGLTCALAMIPEAISVALLAGVSPQVGLWTSVMMGGTAAVFGGRGGPITGASRACAVVIASLVKAKGADHVPLTVLMAGLFQLSAGYLRLAKYIRLVPHPVMMGFVNGLALVIFRAQLSHFRVQGTAAFLQGPALTATVGLAGLTVGLIKLLPLVSAKIPVPSLLAVTVTTAAAKLFHLPVQTLGDLAGSEALVGGLSSIPRLGLPGFTLASQRNWRGVLGLLADVTPFAATMAAVGLIESLLTLQIVDTLVDDGTRGSTSSECKAQGLANVASALSGGMGGCALLGHSLVNLDSGGTARLAGAVMSSSLALTLVFGTPLLAAIPVASIVGLMAVVCHSMFSWSLLRLMGRIPRKDALVLLLVSATVVTKNLGTAVVVGTVCSSLVFAWDMSTLVKAPVRYTESVHGYDTIGGDAFKTAKVYSVEGNVFFGSAHEFTELFAGESTTTGPPLVFIDFGSARVLDHSGVNAINSVCRRLGAIGKKVVLRRLSSDVAAMLKQSQTGGSAGVGPPPFQIVETKKNSDPRYGAAVDR